MKQLRLILILILLSGSINLASETKIIFRYDDYGITHDSISVSIFSKFKANSFPLLVGVIPFSCQGDISTLSITNIQGNSLSDSLLLADDLFYIGLHGFCHIDISPTAVSEFEGVAIATQLDLIRKGKEFLEQKLNKPVEIFIPPWNSYDENTIIALESFGFKVLSARRDNLPVIENVHNIAYVPYTITLKEFIDDFEEILKNGNDKKDELIVVMMHPYDFIEQSSERGIVSLSNFDKILQQIKFDTNLNAVPVPSGDNLKNFSYKRLLHNSYKNYQALPDFLEPNSIYYLDCETRNNNKYLAWLFPIGFYALLFFIVVILSKIAVSQISKHLKIDKKLLFIIMLVAMVFGTIALVLKGGSFKPYYTALIVISIAALSSYLKAFKTD